jgi:DMSO/TMAO reductase YedYZ heme-binding membrane subunit
MLSATATSFPNAVNAKQLFILFLAVPAIVWMIAVGDLWAYFSHNVPRGQILYLFSKLLGIYALYIMAAQIIVGIQGRQSALFRYHRRLGLITAVVVFGHLGLFVTAASLRTGHAAWDNLIPAFDQGFFKSAVSYGIVAAYIMLIVVCSGLALRKLPALLRQLHRLAYVVVGLGWLHSFSIGTETRSLTLLSYYGCLAVLIVAAWLLKSRDPRQRQTRSPTGV